MELTMQALKVGLIIIATMFFLLGTSYLLVQIERSDIVELRFCPHCGEQLLRK